jgi:mannose-6-phosphate isomerase
MPSAKERAMSIERAPGMAVNKPWTSHSLEPWSHAAAANAAEPAGEIWFQRDLSFDDKPDVLFKLLLTTGPLSVQVHADDAFARCKSLENGKTGTWYILAAKPGAGLAAHFNTAELLDAINGGSIENFRSRQEAMDGDVVFVPEGTVHAIGPDMVTAEVQQASDAAFRLFGFGRHRPLNARQVVDCVKSTHAGIRIRGACGSREKRLLAACPYFTFASLDLPPDSRWTLQAHSETWLLAFAGEADFGGITAATGESLLIKSESVDLTVGPDGFRGLVAAASPTAFSTMLTPVLDAFPPQHDPIPKGLKREAMLSRNHVSQTIEAWK